MTNAFAVSSTQPRDINQQRILIVDLINMERRSVGLSAVVQDNSLNTLAQNYALDMVRRGFSGHMNPEGEGPIDRALKLGIKTYIG